MSKKRLIVLSVLCILVVLLSGCSKKAETSGDNLQDEPQPTPTLEPTPEPVQGLPCPLDGTMVQDEADLNLRPIAVMIDNELNARPQSGLLEAEIVFEMPVEGNITRYMAIFHHNPSEKIGPVRSARPYFIDKALEFNAVYVHCGGSPQALKDIADLKVDALNDLKGSPCFWRSQDRKMPHNLYTSTKLMREVTSSKKMENSKAPQYFSFSEDFLKLGGKKTSQLLINYAKDYKVGYEYNENDKLYYRTVNGKRLLDKETNKEITTTNIIVEKTTAKVLDKVGRLELSNIGKNRGYLLTGGELIEIQWSKKGRRDKTLYTDLQGNEIKLNKGKTWVQVVPDYSKIEIKE